MKISYKDKEFVHTIIQWIIVDDVYITINSDTMYTKFANKVKQFKEKTYITHVTPLLGGAITIKINPNKYYNTNNHEKDVDIVTYNMYNTIMCWILNDLNLCEGEYYISRIDLAYNNQADFVKKYVLYRYQWDVLSTYLLSNITNRKEKANKVMDTRGEMHNDKHALSIRPSKNIEIMWYNKDKQSGGNDDAKSRIEFRFKAINYKSIKSAMFYVFKTTKHLLITLADRDIINYVSDAKVGEIIQGYKTGVYKTLSDLIRTYRDKIYNRDVLQKVYDYVNPNPNDINHDNNNKRCSNWLGQYQLSNCADDPVHDRRLQLYSYSQYKSHIDNITRTLRFYINN